MTRTLTVGRDTQPRPLFLCRKLWSSLVLEHRRRPLPGQTVRPVSTWTSMRQRQTKNAILRPKSQLIGDFEDFLAKRMPRKARNRAGTSL